MNRLPGIYLVLFWTLLALLATGQDLLFAALRETELDWGEVLIFKTYWLLMAPVSVLVFWLGDRFPLKAPDEFRHGLIHLLSSVMVSVLHITAFAATMMGLSRLFNMGPPYTFSGVWQKMLATNLIYLVLMYWLILAGHKALTIYREWRLSQLRTVDMERQLSEARLSFLKSQLQPHFLFNTLHSITTLVQLHDHDRAVDMLNRLSELLRNALKENQLQLIPLHKELNILEQYLAIQAVRFADKLLVSVQADDHLLNARVPYMILQPLVENAIKYAVETATGPCRITIAAQGENGQIRLSVRDEGTAKLTTSVRWGNGLRLTEERLQSQYGSHYSLTMCPNDTAGTIVELRFPLQQHD
ncbi:sensor histidine kinase [Spirosoma areae]